MKRDVGVEETMQAQAKSNSEFTLEELEQIFGVADPKILFYRDYCNDMNEEQPPQ